MTGKFIRLTDSFHVSPQITREDIDIAAQMGVTLIINNRPDGEETGPARLSRLTRSRSRSRDRLCRHSCRPAGHHGR